MWRDLSYNYGLYSFKRNKGSNEKMVEVQDKTFISVEELAELDKTNLSILDCSVIIGEGEDPVLSYLKEHIEGAKFLDLKLARDL
jgi:3-mercaptopyruvate sulfurtransferase SseA